MKNLLIVGMIATLSGCAFLQETVDDINTPENREKAANGLVRAAEVSCGAAVAYLKTVGPQLEDAGASYIESLRETCVEAEELVPEVTDDPA